MSCFCEAPIHSPYFVPHNLFLLMNWGINLSCNLLLLPDCYFSLEKLLSPLNYINSKFTSICKQRDYYERLLFRLFGFWISYILCMMTMVFFFCMVLTRFWYFMFCFWARILFSHVFMIDLQYNELSLSPVKSLCFS